jgi:hypothetical protein
MAAADAAAAAPPGAAAAALRAFLGAFTSSSAAKPLSTCSTAARHSSVIWGLSAASGSCCWAAMTAWRVQGLLGEGNVHGAGRKVGHREGCIQGVGGFCTSGCLQQASTGMRIRLSKRHGRSEHTEGGGPHVFLQWDTWRSRCHCGGVGMGQIMHKFPPGHIVTTTAPTSLSDTRRAKDCKRTEPNTVPAQSLRTHAGPVGRHVNSRLPTPKAARTVISSKQAGVSDCCSFWNTAAPIYK